MILTVQEFAASIKRDGASCTLQVQEPSIHLLGIGSELPSAFRSVLGRVEYSRDRKAFDFESLDGRLELSEEKPILDIFGRAVYRDSGNVNEVARRCGGQLIVDAFELQYLGITGTFFADNIESMLADQLVAKTLIPGKSVGQDDSIQVFTRR